MVVATYSHMRTGSGQQWMGMIAQYEIERAAGLELINGLTRRIRQLEIHLSRERMLRAQDAQQYENQILAERQQREQLSLQLEEEKKKSLDWTTRINKLEEQHAQDTQTICAANREIQALSNQVATEREAVLLLSQQLQMLNAQGNALQARVGQMADQIEQQQKRHSVTEQTQSPPESCYKPWQIFVAVLKSLSPF